MDWSIVRVLMAHDFLTGLQSDLAFYFSSVLVLGILAQWLAWRFRIPSILILLVFGFVAGRYFKTDDPTAGITLIGDDLIFPVVSLAVAVILFEGGLSLKFRELREAGGRSSGFAHLGSSLPGGSRRFSGTSSD